MSISKSMVRNIGRQGALLGVALVASAAALVPGCKFSSCADTNSCAPSGSEPDESLGGQGGAPEELPEEPDEPRETLGGMGGTDSEDPTDDIECPEGELLCDDDCVDPLSDAEFCGAADECTGEDAGQSCESGEICVEGACQLDCPSGQVGCDGACVDPMFDDDYCGADAGCQEYSECNARQQCIYGTCASWGEAGTVNFGEGAAFPYYPEQVTIDGAGVVQFAWARDSAGGATNAYTSQLFGEPTLWSVPQIHDLYEPTVTWLDMETNEEGRTVLLFQQVDDGGDPGLHAAIREAGGQWSEAVPISGTAAGADADWLVSFPALTLDEDGNAHAAWAEARGSEDVVVVNRLAAGETNWGVPVDIVPGLGGPTDVQSVSIVSLDDGQAMVVYATSDGASWYWTAARSVDGEFQLGERLFAPTPLGDHVQIATNGEQVGLLWLNASPGGPQWFSTYSDGVWTEYAKLETAGESETLRVPRLVMERSGRMTALWWSDLSGGSLWSATLSAGETAWLTAEEPLALAPNVIDSELAIDGLGNVQLAWIQETGGANSVWTARRRAGQDAFDSPRLVEESDDPASHPSLAFNASGQGVLTWWNAQSTDHILGFTTFR